MKFKVLYLINNVGADADFSGSFEFYVHEEARNSATGWIELGTAHIAFLWNGVTWEYFD